MLQLVKDLKTITDLKVYENVNLKKLTTIKVGDIARLYLVPCTIDSLEKVVKFLHKRNLEYKIVGNGSNLIIKKAPDIVLNLSKLNSIMQYKNSIEVYAGTTISNFIHWCLKHNLGGMESLFGIPGSIGGAVAMNAGANNISIGDFIKEVFIINKDGSYWLTVSKNTFGYRKINLPQNSLICAVKIRICNTKRNKHYCIHPQAAQYSRKNIQSIMKKRISTQPIGKPSAGCIFKNPKEIPAWYLIVQCGLQGFFINDAQVSKKHANFIVNNGNASSADILRLIDIIKERVLKETNIYLKEEVVIWQ